MMTNPTFINTTGLDYAELNPEIIVRVGTADKERYEDIKRLWVFLKTEEKHGQKYSQMSATPSRQTILTILFKEELLQ